jgi:hypothetical protein
MPSNWHTVAVPLCFRRRLQAAGGFAPGVLGDHFGEPR